MAASNGMVIDALVATAIPTFRGSSVSTTSGSCSGPAWVALCWLSPMTVINARPVIEMRVAAR